MRNSTLWKRLIAVCCTLAILLSMTLIPVSAEAETGTKVTASTNASVKQGNSAYCYVYIDSLESLSTLEVTVHFDPSAIRVTGSYNQVNAPLYDSASTDSTLQYTYIFDGNGNNSKTQLFYFQYTVLSDAPTGANHFDIIVGDAYDSSFEILPISGSRCTFTVEPTVTNLSCSVSTTSSVSTTVNQEFTLTYQFSTKSIASGSAVIHFDPELFAVSEVIQGDFLTDKMTDINTSLSGAVYISFLGTTYSTGRQFLTLRFKTLKNTAQDSNISLTVSDLYDLQFNSIACNGYKTAIHINYDSTYDETAPSVLLREEYDPQTQKLSVQVYLEENSHLGAGDFVLRFDPERFAYVSAEKGYSPTFFSTNDKKADEGILKFSVISLTDHTAAVTMLTAIFDVIMPCEDTNSQLEISGSGLADYLTKPIVLNFSGCTVKTAGHTPQIDAAVAPTCLDTGLTEGNHCVICKKILVKQETVSALGHDEVHHTAQAQTCTEVGWEDYVTCSRCDYTTYSEIPANGHSYYQSICTVCSDVQNANYSWDISAADGSLIAKLYLNNDGTYDLQITGAGAMKNWTRTSAVPWNNYRQKITRVLFADGLTTIGGYAFYGCSALKEISLPGGVTSIGSSAFANCTGLTELELPEGLTTIGSSAFSSCTGLTKAVLPESLVTVGNSAFYNCTAFTMIEFNAVDMSNLSSNNYVFSFAGQSGAGIVVTIGANVTQIPAYLFHPYGNTSYAPKIKSVEFAKDSVCKTIGSYAFYSCSSLSELIIPENVTTINGYAFGNVNLKLVYIYSDEIVANATSASACGYLLSSPKTVIIPADIVTVSSYIKEKYANEEAITYQGIDYICYSSCNHSWTEQEVLIPRIACEQDGLVRHYCTDCGAYKDVTVFRHIVTTTAAKEPTCLENGWYEYETCTQCDYSTYSEIAALGHNLIHHDAKAESCLESGWYAYDTCSRCDYTTYTEIPALGHDEIHHTAQTVTCLEIGWYAYETCSRCDYSTYSEIAALGHDLIHHDAKAETCLEIGWYAYETCSRCDYSTCSEIAALGHDLIHHDAKTETCLEIGWYAYDTCSRCDYTTYTEIQALGHDYIYHEAQAQNCTEIGWYAYETCSRCDYSTYSEIAALGHDLIHHDAKAETCLEIGWDAYNTCSRCDYSSYSENAALGHNLTHHNAKTESCLEIGWYAYDTCSRCEYSTYTEIQALGHDYIYHEAQEQNCTEIGWYAYETCSRCEYSTYVVIPADGHSFMDKVCIVCSADQPPTMQWDLSVQGDGSVMAYAYRHMDGTYLLEIRGNGPTKNYSSYSSPFSSISSKIDDIWVCDGVTAIGDYLFCNLRIQGNVTIADSVTTIGDHSFYGFSGPKTIHLPASIASIGDFAFYGSQNLIVILQGDKLPASLGSIWDYNCGHYLQPQKVIYTDDAIYVIDRDGKAWLAKYYKNETEFVSETSVEGVPVTGIGAFAFDQKNKIITYTVPAEIKIIERYAFRECNNLTVLFESNSYPSGFSGSSYETPPSYLAPQKAIRTDDCLYVLDRNGQLYLSRYLGSDQHVTVDAEVNGLPVQHIGMLAFRSRNVQSIILPDTIETIGDYAFQHCTMSQITLPDSLTKIGTWGFFGADITSITIPKNVTVIKDSTFSYCERLNIVYVQSPVIAKGITSTYSYGDLCRYPQTVVIPAAVENSHLSQMYSHQEYAYVMGMDCVIYSNCAHNWTQRVAVEMIPCQTNGMIVLTCDTCSVEKTEVVPCHDEIHHEAQIPTCISIGWDAYVTCSACDYSTYQELPISDAHNYGEPSYQINGDGTHTTILTCIWDDSHTKELAAEPHTFDGSGHQCICGYELLPVTAWNLALDGNIAMNLHLNVSGEKIASASATANGEPLDLAALPLDESGYPVLTIELAAAQMTDNITVTLTVDGITVSKNYSVRQYCDTILADPALSSYHALVKEMLNYGAMAQVYFDYNTDILANEDITGVAEYAVPDTADEIVIDGHIDDIAFYGASLVYRDRISIRFYFTGDLSSCNFTANGNTYCPIVKDGLYCIEVADIVPQELDKQITLTATDASGNTLSVAYSPMNYIVRMNQTGNDNLKALLKALYNYHLSAKQLFGDKPISVEQWNVVLIDRIHVNFYLSMSQNVAQSAQLQIKVGDYTTVYDVADLQLTGNGLYAASIELAAAQMTDRIVVQIVLGGYIAMTETYTVRQYCDIVLANEDFSQYHALVKEMLHYGAMAQLYFDYDAENLANDGITGAAAADVPETAEEMTVNDKISGLNFYGASLVYRDRIAVRYYFMGDVTGCTFTANGSSYSPIAKDSMYYVEIADILPQDLDQQITLTVTDANGNTLSVTYGPMNYIVRMNAKGSDNLKNLLKALYNYHLTAKRLSETSA